MSKYLVRTVNIILMGVVLFACSKDDEGPVISSFLIKFDAELIAEDSPNDLPISALISVKNEDGDSIIFEDKLVDLNNLGDHFETTTLEIKVGGYYLTGFALLDESDSVIFYAPSGEDIDAAGSSSSLPIKFTTKPGQLTAVVINTLEKVEQEPEEPGTEIIEITLNVERDAMIRYYNGDGDDRNYGDYAFLNMHAWTNNSAIVWHRSLLEFDLSTLNDATILKATLNLFTDSNTTGMFKDGHNQLSGSNECIVSRITTSWIENQVTWNTQPVRDTENQLTLAASDSAFQDYFVDVKAMLQHMVDNKESSFGFMLQLKDETPYRRMVFASSDNPDASIHPTLTIEAEVPKQP